MVTRKITGKVLEPSPSKVRVPRADGMEKRSHILHVAGRLYAEKGYARTTSKEVCEAAGTDMAAVNYHFGSKGALYEAVLTEAHAHLMGLDELEKIAGSAGSPESKLSALLGLLMQRSKGNSGTTLPWGMQVLVHEIMAPSSSFAALVKKVEVPKMRLVMAIVAGVLGLPPNDPAVQRAIAFVIMPCVMMAIAPKEVKQTFLPALGTDPQAVLDDMTRYALAGLRAIKASRGKKVKAGKSLVPPRKVKSS